MSGVMLSSYMRMYRAHRMRKIAIRFIVGATNVAFTSIPHVTVLAQAASPTPGLGTHAQKPFVLSDSAARTNAWWMMMQPSVGFGGITPDGRYILYTLQNTPTSGRAATVLRALDGSWTRHLPEGHAEMTHDGKLVLLQGTGDSLWFFPVGRDTQAVFPHVREYQLFRHDDDEWLAYTRTEPQDELVVRKLATGEEYRVARVTRYVVAPSGNAMLLITAPHDTTQPPELSWFDLATGHSASIGQGAGLREIAFDAESRAVAFLTEAPRQAPDRNAPWTPPVMTLWFYRPGMTAARVIVTGQATIAGIDTTLTLAGGGVTFSRDGRHLFVNVIERRNPTPPPDAVQVDVWHYNDPRLQSEQLGAVGPRSFEAVVDLPTSDTESARVRQLRFGNEWLEWGHTAVNDQVIVYNNAPVHGHWWDFARTSTYTWMSPIDGTRRTLRANLKHGVGDSQFSPDGQWLLYYDQEKHHWFSYAPTTGEEHNISQRIPVPIYGIPPRPTPPERLWAAGFLGWGLASRSTVPAGASPSAAAPVRTALLSDSYDVWQVDVSGRAPPVNLTAGYGRRHRLQFHTTFLTTESGAWSTAPTWAPGDTVLLSAYSPDTKVNGFCRIVMPTHATERPHDPECGAMTPHTMYVETGQGTLEHGIFLAKAREANVWIVQRENATEYRNLFVTRDFRTYTRLTDVQPQRAYNWLTAELVHWTAPDGLRLSGILYKPENFDPHRKYPLIVSIYEQQSDELIRFPEPGWTSDALNAPYFVSRGYLVFLPDIVKRRGAIGPAALESVVSGARMLAQRPYVDRKHLAVYGHSFGGYETNYIVSHTSLFAAAVASAGPADLVSEYGSLRGVGGMGGTNQDYYEEGQPQIGGTLWQVPGRYLQNSPLFHADRVTTPILLVHNRQDANVPFQQGVEWFSALRRTGKRVWMLQYDQGQHGVSELRDMIDRTQRTLQFLDHYLKGAPAPVWMTRGIPARERGRETGLALDPGGREP